MAVQIKLLSMPSLDNTYVNTIDFASIGAQSSWFDNKVGKIVEGNIRTDTEQEQLVLNTNYQSVRPYDYLYLTDPSGKRIYYFITNKAIKTSDTVVLDIECDVWNTYLFDFQLMDSFVERTHVNRWSGDIPTMEIVDEGLPFGEQIYSSYENMYTLNNSYVMTATSPLGKVEDDYYKPGTGGDLGECWKEGKASRDGFRFMKGYEGMAPYLYYDSGGVATIGYGVTQSELDIFNKLVAAQPIPEEMAAKESYYLKQERYGKVILKRFQELGCTRQTQFDALVDLAFNAGNGRILDDNVLTLAIMRNPNDEAYIRPIWENFIVSDAAGNVLEGLKLRRKAECDIYFNKGYEFRPIVTIKADGSYGPPVAENEGNGWLPDDCGSGDGTGPNPVGYWVQNEEGAWACPAEGTVSATYPTYPEGGAHNGIDIANVLNTPIYAMRDGTVTVSGPVSGFGHAIYIDHGNGIISRYGHMYANGLLVNVGDKVTQGQKIALMGNDGQSTGNHLHFDFQRNGIHFNPATNLRVGQVL